MIHNNESKGSLPNDSEWSLTDGYEAEAPF